MSIRIINITVPSSFVLPEIISTFSPDESKIMLEIGCECLKEGRRSVVGLTHKELFNKITNDSLKQILKLENDLTIQKETTINVRRELAQVYDSQHEQLNKQIELLKGQLKCFDNDNKEKIRNEIDKARDKYDLLLQEKDKQILKINDTHDLLLSQSQKSTASKGKDGEKEFEIYGDETFRDFKGYELIDKHTQGGAGDFHMRFEEFNVLVDAKNYKKKVPIEQRDKIKNDLLKNDHMTFAWLVSLNTSIDKFDKSPVMYEWINTKQCVVYINNLLQHDDPKKILRIVWFTCKELYKLVADVSNDDIELTDLKEKQFKFMDKIRNIRKTMREINTTLNTTRNMLQLVDEQLKEMLDTETSQIIDSNYSMFDEWWDANIVLTNGDEKMLSTELWIKFKHDNKSVVKDLNITTDKFKQFLKSKTQMSNILLKSKNANSALEIKGIKLVISTPNL